MINRTKKLLVNNRRKKRIRYKLRLNGNRPRLVFNKSNRYIMAQIIDDKLGNTLAFAVSSEESFPVKEGSKKNKKAAAEVGKLIAKRALDKGIKQVMLDRSGLAYHGKIAAFAEAAREAGLEF